MAESVREGSASVTANHSKEWEQWREAFEVSSARGLLALGRFSLSISLPPSLSWRRDFAHIYLTRLYHAPGLDSGSAPELPPPSDDSAGAAATLSKAAGAGKGKTIETKKIGGIFGIEMVESTSQSGFTTVRRRRQTGQASATGPEKVEGRKKRQSQNSMPFGSAPPPARETSEPRGRVGPNFNKT